MSVEQVFSSYIYRLYKPCRGCRGSLGTNFYVIYIDCTGHEQTVVEAYRATFFNMYLGCRGQLQAAEKSLE
jgi:hypothetical protein